MISSCMFGSCLPPILCLRQSTCRSPWNICLPRWSWCSNGEPPCVCCVASDPSLTFYHNLPFNRSFLSPVCSTNAPYPLKHLGCKFWQLALCQASWLTFHCWNCSSLSQLHCRQSIITCTHFPSLITQVSLVPVATKIATNPIVVDPTRAPWMTVSLYLSFKFMTRVWSLEDCTGQSWRWRGRLDSLRHGQWPPFCVVFHSSIISCKQGWRCRHHLVWERLRSSGTWKHCLLELVWGWVSPLPDISSWHYCSFWSCKQMSTMIDTCCTSHHNKCCRESGCHKQKIWPNNCNKPSWARPASSRALLPSPQGHLVLVLLCLLLVFLLPPVVVCLSGRFAIPVGEFSTAVGIRVVLTKAPLSIVGPGDPECLICNRRQCNWWTEIIDITMATNVTHLWWTWTAEPWRQPFCLQAHGHSSYGHALGPPRICPGPCQGMCGGKGWLLWRMWWHPE